MNKLEYTKEDIIDLQNQIDKLYQENKQLKVNRDKAIKFVAEKDNLKSIISRQSNYIDYLNKKVNRQKGRLKEYKEEKEQLQAKIVEAIKCIEYYAIETDDYTKLYNNEELDLLKILRGDNNDL